LAEAGVWIGPRSVLEENEEFRQIIPYIVLQYGSRFVRYTRTAAGGEARLHGKTSIGLGGHIDLCDVKTRGQEIDLLATLTAAADRELEEELGGVECEAREWIGMLVDNESAVGRVHLGIIGLWRLRALPAGLTEDAIGALACCTLDALRADHDRLEGWSAMLLPALEARFAASL
jgi:predicted NUDIX family phosphoesterase